MSILLFAGAAHAATLALQPTGGSPQVGWTDRLELGARFSVSTPLLVGGLGYYDSGSDGFVSSHAVTLWDDIGNVITSVEVSSLSPTEGGVFAGGEFRFVPINVTLQPGYYRLSGRLDDNTFLDPVLLDNYSPGDPPLTFPGITYVGRALGPSGSGAGAFPSVVLDYAATDWFGPNMLVTQVPEPAQLSLILVGLASALYFRRKR